MNIFVFPKVKTVTTHYADIGRLGKFGAGFQQVLMVQMFSRRLFTILSWNIKIVMEPLRKHAFSSILKFYHQKMKIFR